MITDTFDCRSPAIINPRVHPELSPRQWSPATLVLKSVSIFTRLE